MLEMPRHALLPITTSSQQKPFLIVITRITELHPVEMSPKLTHLPKKIMSTIYDQLIRFIFKCLTQIANLAETTIQEKSTRNMWK